MIPGRGETLVFDILKVEWSVAVASLPSSITTNKVCVDIVIKVSDLLIISLLHVSYFF